LIDTDGKVWVHVPKVYRELSAAVGFCVAWVQDSIKHPFGGESGLLVPLIFPHDAEIPVLGSLLPEGVHRPRYTIDKSIVFGGEWVLKNPHGEAVAHGAKSMMRAICNAMNFVEGHW
jgi:hypothetical protein